MRREQTPSWIGPAVAALLALMIIGLAALVWMTLDADQGDQGEEAEPHAAFLSAVRIERAGGAAPAGTLLDRVRLV